MKKEDLIILGAGENGIMAADIIEKNNIDYAKYKIIGYLDDDKNKIGNNIAGYPVLGPMSSWKECEKSFFTSPLVSSPKNNHLKKVIFDKLKIPNKLYINIISRDLKLPEDLISGNANLIISGSQFQSNIKIGSNIYISNNVVICSNTKIDDYVNISNSASIQGGVQIEEGAYIGANSSIIGYTKIGKWSIVGMGSVVLNEVEDFQIVAGNPARVIGVNEAAKEYFQKNNTVNGK
jgi:acetyltransferase EpsM